MALSLVRVLFLVALIGSVVWLAYLGWLTRDDA
jgi:hypothetical protein